jgi:tetratricopeptide (TPR) repeat protein
LFLPIGYTLYPNWIVQDREGEQSHITIKIDQLLTANDSLFIADSARAFANIRDAISLSKKINDPDRLCSAYLKLARFFDLSGNLKQAKEVLTETMKLLPLIENPETEASFYMQRAIVSYYEGNFRETFDDIWIALDGYEKLGDTNALASCIMMIGVTYMEIKDTKNALKYYLRAQALYRETENKKLLGMVAGNIGIIYKMERNYQEALKYYNEALQINEESGNDQELRIVLNNLGSMYMETGDYRKAAAYYSRSKEIAINHRSPIGIITVNFNLALIESKSGNYELAIRKFHEVMDMAQEIQSGRDVRDVYRELSYNYEMIGNLGKALDYRKKYEFWKDSLMHENHLKEIKELELNYETAKKNEEITRLANENELQQQEAKRQSTLKMTFIAGSVLMSLIAFLIFYVFRQRLKNHKLLAEKNNELKETQFRQQLGELEIKALRAQINPHFLFNCMNSINRMILSKEIENASRYMTKFSKLVRLILENTESKSISLENELTMLKSYIELEELRFKGKIRYKINVAENIDRENTCLPSMILQPFVENAIWHGLMHKEDFEDNLLVISIEETNGSISCIVEDNGVGRERSRELNSKNLYKNKSLGVKITEERLRILNKNANENLVKYNDIKDVNHRATGTRVEIRIPN